MWALRPVSNSIKNWISRLGTFPPCHVRSETAMGCYDGSKIICGPSIPTYETCYDLKKSYNSNSIIPNGPIWNHFFSSQADIKSTGEEDSSEYVDNEARESERFHKPSEALSQNKSFYNQVLVEPKLCKTIRITHSLSLYTVLDKWVEDGNEIKAEDKVQVMHFLQKFNLYAKAVKFSNWMEKSEKVAFDEYDYACRVTLIGKSMGILEAEKCVERIPSSFRGEIVYSALLNVCNFSSNVRKAEQVFKKMKDLKVPITSHSFNKMLSLYSKITIARDRIPALLLSMDGSNVKPTISTYSILLDAKGRSKDMTGMEAIYLKMKSEGMQLGVNTMSVVFKHYMANGLREKAEGVLKEMEDINTKESRRILLPLYASLGKTDEIKKLWVHPHMNPRHDDYVSAIEAWGQAGDIKQAECVFEELVKKSRPTSRTSFALLEVYLEHEELGKAKGFMKRLTREGWPGHCSCWDVLAKLFLNAGELEKADAALQRVLSAADRGRRWFTTSFLRLMDGYAERGDVHNCERIFEKSRKFGHVTNFTHFQVLLRAYANSQRTAYGILERMQAEGIVGSSQELRQRLMLPATNIADLNLFE